MTDELKPCRCGLCGKFVNKETGEYIVDLNSDGYEEDSGWVCKNCK